MSLISPRLYRQIVGVLDHMDDVITKRMVPRAGIEPALLSEPHFECGASTSSANGAKTRSEAITRALEEDKMSYNNMPSGAPVDPLDYKVESLVANGERPSVDSTLSHSKPFQVGVEDSWSTAHAKGELRLHEGNYGMAMNMRYRLLSIRTALRLPGNLQIAFKYDTRGHFYAQVYEVDAIDNVTGEFITWQGRKWLLSEHMTDAEIVQTVFKAVMTAVEHETRETFLYKGQSVFDPHYDLEKLVELRQEKNSLVHRT